MIRLKTVLASMLAILMLLSLVSCSHTDNQPADTSATPKKSGTTSSDSTAASQDSTYPLVIIDMLGRSVELSQRPERIITISPTATEMLYRIGGIAVARDSSSRYPPESQQLPAVGGAYSPSIEAIAAQDPDLILIEALTQGHLVKPLQQIGAPVFAVRATSLDDIAEGMEVLGRVIGQEVAAEQAVQEMRARIDTAISTVAFGKSVLILISDADRNLYAANPKSYAGTVAALLRMRNLAEGMPDSGPYPGFTQFSAEQAVTAAPDFLFTISPAPAPAPKLSAVLRYVPGYSELAAVKEGRVQELDPVLFIQAPGPRIADAVEEMVKLLEEAS